ncbi:amino acid/amide ABC transporter substrate-binding protein, HAAT family (TC 3.A.1.4.-) [Pseudovibrio ascidiaceicola]|uniref:Amino acid/amide ABC transporter substrate-binding protein, HAAT family (TC 3.A.1.4.-) n=1 Tax=Pseudovibrio ascidiaceicola TaxID=285279 RepID=A0A1I4ADZ6_9HYPH|nr:ABC transporter substrate-binding protein [Pseudovibrio ascidiaceicola]SFK54574.1 amino acid/amide ABC transporter substrate-binding protein, HAAT family (TC 3.A.1.4.-) [Pseudovibrio ascidiaceicola]
MKHFTNLGKAVAAGALAVAMSTAAMAADGLNFPNLTYRTGPFAGTGTPIMNGQRDYMLMLNERDGGIGGVPIDYIECETGYNTNKGVECYEKTKGEALVTQPWSTGITLQVMPRTNVDRIPILAPGYGFSPMSDGDTFAWAFNPPVSYWDGAYMILDYIASGDMSSLKGKKIVLLHLDHPFGKEPIPLLEKLAEMHDFKLVPIPVGLKEMQNQSAQWLQIRRERPDNVVMWGWGAMNAGAITEAVKTRYPMENFIGIWWSGSDADLQNVGAKAKGYKSVSFNAPGNFPVLEDIRKHVVSKGNSEIKSEADMDTIFYQRGIIISMILAEAAKTAQDNFGEKNINAEQLRWGLENLDITAARLEELGMKGMTPPLKMACDNHTGHSGAWMLEWNGEEFVQASDLLTPNRELIKPLELEKAADYAKNNAPWPGRGDLACN